MINRSIIVLCEGLTGSSAIAVVIKQLGIAICGTSVGTNKRHPFGNLEDKKFTSVNKEMLDELGVHPFESDIDHIAKVVRKERLEKLYEKHRITMSAYIQTRNLDGEVWGLKDPSLWHTIDIWHKEFPDPHYIFWDRRGFSKSVRVKKRRFVIFRAKMERFLIGKKYIAMCYENLCQNPADEIKRVEEFIGVPHIDGIESFVRPELDSNTT